MLACSCSFKGCLEPFGGASHSRGTGKAVYDQPSLLSVQREAAPREKALSLLLPGGCLLSPARLMLLPLSPVLSVAHEHLKERGLFGLPGAATNPSDYYHQMTLMASHPAPYGDLLMQSGGAMGTPHLHDYLNPVDGECWGWRCWVQGP